MLFLIAISLSADAFAVTISNLLAYKKSKMIRLCPFYFGIYQGVMPIIGYFLINLISENILKLANVIVFCVLTFIGFKMICEAILPEKREKPSSLTHKRLNIEAITTSIDALGVGISLCFMEINIFYASFIIAITTFLVCIIAIIVFSKIGNKLNDKFEITAGVILMCLGIKSLF